MIGKMSDKCKFLVNVLKNAKNDSERFAGLMIVVQTLKSDVLTELQRREIFKTIGSSFPCRLVNAVNRREDENKQVYFSIGISIISIYCSDSLLIQNPAAADAVDGVLTFLPELDIESDLNLIKDSLQYLLLLSSTECHVKFLT